MGLILDFWLESRSVEKSQFVIVLTLRPMSPIDRSRFHVLLTTI